MDQPFVLAQSLRCDARVELVGVGDTGGEERIEVVEGSKTQNGGQSEPNCLRSASGHVERVMGRRLGTGTLGVDGFAIAADHVAVERVLDPGERVRRAPQPTTVAVVLREQQLRPAVAV